jgi:alpha-beta hydrolase superfamily lysophospholipase
MFKLYEGSYHEVWNDLDKEILFADIIHWIAARLP